MLDLNNHFETYTGEIHAQWGEHREDYHSTAMEPGSAGSAKLKVIQGLQRADLETSPAFWPVTSENAEQAVKEREFYGRCMSPHSDPNGPVATS